MTNLNMLETFRTKEELLNYFKKIGQNVTEEEIENLKKSYEQAQQIDGALSLKQLNNVAGGMKGAFSGENHAAKRAENPANGPGMKRSFPGGNPLAKREAPCDLASGTPIQQHTEVHGDFPCYPLDGCSISMISKPEATVNICGINFFRTQQNGETLFFYGKDSNTTPKGMLSEIKGLTTDSTGKITSLNF